MRIPIIICAVAAFLFLACAASASRLSDLWVNASKMETDVSYTSIMCILGDCRSAWPVDTWNTSAQVLAIAQSRTDWTAHDNYPAGCGATEAVRVIGDALTCVDLTSISDGNSSEEMIAAVNNSFIYNLTAYNAYYVDNATERELFTRAYNASYMTSTYNSSYDAQLGHNTTNEIFAAVNNGTFQTGSELWNTTNEAFRASDNSTFHRINLLLNFSNITVCAEDQILKIVGGAWTCSAEAGASGNTTAQVIAAINSTGNGFFNLTSWYTWYVNNATERTLFTNTYNASYLTNSYNASYDSQLGHNTTAEIQAAQTITGNTTNQIFAAVDNSTFHRFSQQITWANLSSWSLNNVWTGSLGWGNVSARSLDIVWAGKLDWGNISNAVIYNASYDAQLGHNTTDEVFAAVNNNTFQTGSELWNTTAQVQAAQTVNTTAEVRAAQTINSTTEVRTAIYSATMNLSNITAPSDCAASNYAYGFDSSGILKCRADQTGGGGGGVNYWQTDGAFWMSANESAGGYGNINITNLNATAGVNASRMCIGGTCVTAWPFNTTAEVQAAQKTTGNTTNEIFKAVDNRTFHRYNDTMTATNITASITSAQLAQAFSVLWGNVTGRSLDIVWAGSLNAGNLSNILANARLDASVKRVNDSATLNISNITAPTDCASANYVYGFSNVLSCRADLFNTSAQIQAAQTVNTSTEVNAALNSSFFTLNRPWAAGTLGWGNVSARSLDIVWTGGLRWDNITNYDINEAWVGTLGGRNITNATLTNASLTSDFTLRWGNVTNRDLNIVWLNNLAWGNISSRSLDIVWAGGLDAANITTGTLRDSLLNDAVYQINGTTRLTQGNLSSAFSILNANVSVTTDFNMGKQNITSVRNITFVNDAGANTAMIYWNGTGLITKII